jgi:hypothetical protein
MKANFDGNVPRKDRTSAGEAVSQMAAPGVSAPIPIHRSKDSSTQIVAMPLERRMDPVRLQLAEQLDRAQHAEKRFARTLETTQVEMVALAADLKAALRRLTDAERRVGEKQRVLKQLLKRVSMLEVEREAASKAREALEALQQQYDEYHRMKGPGFTGRAAGGNRSQV